MGIFPDRTCSYIKAKSITPELNMRDNCLHVDIAYRPALSFVLQPDCHQGIITMCSKKKRRFFLFFML